MSRQENHTHTHFLFFSHGETREDSGSPRLSLIVYLLDPSFLKLEKWIWIFGVWICGPLRKIEGVGVCTCLASLCVCVSVFNAIIIVSIIIVISSIIINIYIYIH